MGAIGCIVLNRFWIFHLWWATVPDNFEDFVDLNNHFSWFHKLPSGSFSIHKSINVYVLIDMRWCLQCISPKYPNNLAWSSTLTVEGVSHSDITPDHNTKALQVIVARDVSTVQALRTQWNGILEWDTEKCPLCTRSYLLCKSAVELSDVIMIPFDHTHTFLTLVPRFPASMLCPNMPSLWTTDHSLWCHWGKQQT